MCRGLRTPGVQQGPFLPPSPGPQEVDALFVVHDRSERAPLAGSECRPVPYREGAEGEGIAKTI